MALEIERKYLEVDFDSLRRRLRQCGAQGGDVHLERNRIYDLPDGYLRAGQHLLRLPSQEWPDHAQNVLTLKLPPVSAPDAAFKVREERETPVTDAAQMHDLFRRGRTPRVKPTKSCNACSLKDLCLPRLTKTGSVQDYLRAGMEEPS